MATDGKQLGNKPVILSALRRRLRPTVTGLAPSALLSRGGLTFDVRFASESGHVQCTRPCPLWAKSRHQWTTLREQKDRLAAVPPKLQFTFLVAQLLFAGVFVSKRIFEKVVVSALKVIFEAKDLKAIVSTDGPKL